jgi:hypothetical protein
MALPNVLLNDNTMWYKQNSFTFKYILQIEKFQNNDFKTFQI